MIQQTFPVAQQLIANALQLIQQLEILLNKELQNLLGLPDSDLIAEIATDKKDIVVQLEQSNKQLEQMLAIEQLPNKPDSLDVFFQMAEGAGLATHQTAENWQKLIVLCQQCKMLNEKNGASIDLLARNTKRTLNLLKGKSEIVTSYGPDGSTVTEYYSRTLFSV